jgi:hypothetical protein
MGEILSRQEGAILLRAERLQRDAKIEGKWEMRKNPENL